MARDLGVERHLDLAAEGLRALNRLKQRSIRPQDDVHSLVFFAHLNAPQQDIVLGFADRSPAQFADDGTLPATHWGRQMDRPGFARQNGGPVVVKDRCVAFVGDVGFGGGFGHGALRLEKIFRVSSYRIDGPSSSELGWTGIPKQELDRTDGPRLPGYTTAKEEFHALVDFGRACVWVRD